MISIVTPVYHAQQFIAQTYASIKAQTIDNYEWLLIIDDGCMSDYQLLLPNDDRITLLSTRISKSGPAVARNIGLNHALGEYICHLDADDLMYPERLEILLTCAQRTGVSGDVQEIFVHETGEVLGKCIAFQNEIMMAEDIVALNMPVVPFYRRDYEVRWQPVSFAEDVLFCYELLKKIWWYGVKSTTVVTLSRSRSIAVS